MQTLAVHPALWQLLRLQAIGKICKLKANFSSPRRQLLSVLALVLAVVWLGNAVASMLLRDAYEPVAFGRWMSRSLLLYFFWHVIRVAYTRPESSQEWSPPEQIYLCGGPFWRRELLTYRLMGNFSATLPKAGLVAFVLWPDLPLFATGFFGLLLGLVFLEYLRMLLETLVVGMSQTGFALFRTIVFGSLIAVIGFGLFQAVSVVELDGKNHWQFLSAWAGAIGTIIESIPGQLVEAPFRVFANVIAAQEPSLWILAQLGSALVLVMSAAHFAIRCDASLVAKSQDSKLASSREECPNHVYSSSAGVPCILRLGGVGTVAWRQWHFARRHWGSLSVGLGVPAVLASLPLLVPGNGLSNYLTVFAGVVFYSFVLLPAALKLDFRRDFDQLGLLKSLPLRPWVIVTGQLAIPVMLTWLFQMGVLLSAAAVCRVPWEILGHSILLLLPVSVCFIALDNLIFLLYPHRLHQEGLEVFLRSTLTFTAKGLLLVAALLGVIGWLHGAKALTAALGNKDFFRWIFVCGLTGFALLFAAVAVFVSVWAFSKIDPVEV